MKNSGFQRKRPKWIEKILEAQRTAERIEKFNRSSPNVRGFSSSKKIGSKNKVEEEPYNVFDYLKYLWDRLGARGWLLSLVYLGLIPSAIPAVLLDGVPFGVDYPLFVTAVVIAAIGWAGVIANEQQKFISVAWFVGVWGLFLLPNGPIDVQLHIQFFHGEEGILPASIRSTHLLDQIEYYAEKVPLLGQNIISVFISNLMASFASHFMVFVVYTLLWGFIRKRVFPWY